MITIVQLTYIIDTLWRALFALYLTAVRQAAVDFLQVARAIIIKSAWSNTKTPSSQRDDYIHPATYQYLI